MPPVKQTIGGKPLTLPNNVQRQRVDTVNTQRLGGILSRAIAVSDLPETYIKAIVYGVNRVGKTTWACQFPKPLLLIDVEPAVGSGGARSVKGVGGVTFLKLEDTDSVSQLAQELASNNPFKTVVIDSATSLERIVLAEILKLPELKDLMKPSAIGLGPAGMDIYMKRSENMRRILRHYVDLPCHAVFTAKEKDHNPNKSDLRSKVVRVQSQHDESFWGPDMGGGTVEWLRDACDYIMQLTIQKEVVTKRIQMGNDVVEQQVETGKNVRRLRMTYHPNFAAGCRSEHQNVPEFIDNPTFDKFMSVIQGTYKAT